MIGIPYSAHQTFIGIPIEVIIAYLCFIERYSGRSESRLADRAVRQVVLAADYSSESAVHHLGHLAVVSVGVRETDGACSVKAHAGQALETVVDIIHPAIVPEGHPLQSDSGKYRVILHFINLTIMIVFDNKVVSVRSKVLADSGKIISSRKKEQILPFRIKFKHVTKCTIDG